MLAEDGIVFLALQFHRGKLLLVLAGPIDVTGRLVHEPDEVYLGCHMKATLAKSDYFASFRMMIIGVCSRPWPIGFPANACTTKSSDTGKFSCVPRT